jgi:hypothetical protein
MLTSQDGGSTLFELGRRAATSGVELAHPKNKSKR